LCWSSCSSLQFSPNRRCALALKRGRGARVAAERRQPLDRAVAVAAEKLLDSRWAGCRPTRRGRRVRSLATCPRASSQAVAPPVRRLRGWAQSGPPCPMTYDVFLRVAQPDRGPIHRPRARAQYSSARESDPQHPN
jgi:hypothetical protein